jgi:hypothetical protein
MNRPHSPEDFASSFWEEKAAGAGTSPHYGDAVPVNALRGLIDPALDSDKIDSQTVPAGLYLELLREVARMRDTHGEQCVALSAAHLGALAAISETVLTAGTQTAESSLLLLTPAADLDSAA